MYKKILYNIKTKNINVGIIGLGYVGLKLLLQFGKKKFKVYGFDKDINKINILKKNKSPISYIKDREIRNISKYVCLKSNLKNTIECDIIIICLPTPLTPKNKPDLSHIKNCMENLKKYLRVGQTIILESTTYPGTTENIILNNLKKFELGKNFFLGYSPEREDPGSKNFTFYNTPKIISGYTKNCLKVINSIYSTVVKKTVISENIKIAETAKIFENVYRSVNIALVNEMKFVLNSMNIDINKVIDLAKTKPFGFSEFRPGPGVGGHCIPIDPLYLSWIAEKNGYNSEFIKLASQVNIKTTKKITRKIINIASKKKNKKILIIGLAYKKNIEDKRESASIKIMTELLNKGFDVRFEDKFVKNVKIRKKILKSNKLNYKDLNKFSIIIIGTDHDYIDYKQLLKNSKLIIDLRNRYKYNDKKILKL